MERQTGVTLHYEKTGESFPVETAAGVHIYRIVQEALNNVVRHAETKEAWVRLNFSADALELQVEDHGKGFVKDGGQRGIGLVGMRERAELVGGELQVVQREDGGTMVRLRVPRERVEAQVG
jgi:signal transduction histidine kinase